MERYRQLTLAVVLIGIILVIAALTFAALRSL